MKKGLTIFSSIPFLLGFTLLFLPQHLFKNYLPQSFIPNFNSITRDSSYDLEVESQIENASLPRPKCILPIAKVVMRTETTWNSFLWIVPEIESSDFLQINAPVTSGNCLLGVIDYVGKKSCRVRLISDPQMHAAVRALRGKSKFESDIDSLQTRIKEQPELFDKQEHSQIFSALLDHIKTKISGEKPLYLAKGQLCGLTESQEGLPLLKGEGFQYDFEDNHGPSRDLRGKTPLIFPGDVLVTSGLDGIFPEGLLVGEVHTVFPLMEGGISYNILVTPAIDPRCCPSWVTIQPVNPMQEEKMPTQEDIYTQLIQQSIEQEEEVAPNSIP